MGLKKKNKKRCKEKHARVHGDARRELILRIVASDKLFCNKQSPAGEFYEGPCIHCNAVIVVELDGSSLATVEHIVPLTAGGSSTDVANLALACSRCNNEKGIRHDQSYKREQRSTDVIDSLLKKREKRLTHV